MGTRLAGEVVRRRYTVTGVVQGVGFRPFVHRIAAELALSGFVGNAAGEVFVEVQGDADAVAVFADRLVAQAPPLARIAAWSTRRVRSNPGPGSRSWPAAAGRASRPIPPDVAVCDDCIARAVRPRRPSLPAPVRHVHQLRSAVHHHPRPALRPPGHHHVGVQHVRGVRGRVPRPGRPPVPRAADGLPGLRAVALASLVRRERVVGRMPRWRPPSRQLGPRAPWSQSRASAVITWLVVATRGRGRRVASTEGAGRQAVRDAGARSRRRAPATPTSTMPRPRCSRPPGRSCCCGGAAGRRARRGRRAGSPWLG